MVMLTSLILLIFKRRFLTFFATVKHQPHLLYCIIVVVSFLALLLVDCCIIIITILCSTMYHQPQHNLNIVISGNRTILVLYRIRVIAVVDYCVCVTTEPYCIAPNMQSLVLSSSYDSCGSGGGGEDFASTALFIVFFLSCGGAH
jgi:hypothetical protein